MLGQRGKTAKAYRRIAVSEQTYYRWHKEYGGLKTDQARRMKDNLRLRRAISDLTLDKLILQEAARGKLLSPARWRRCIDQCGASCQCPSGEYAECYGNIDRHIARCRVGRTTSSA